MECKGIGEEAPNYLRMDDQELLDLIKEPQQPTYVRGAFREFFFGVRGKRRMLSGEVIDIRFPGELPVITHLHHFRGKCYTYFAAMKVENGKLVPQEDDYHMKDIHISFGFYIMNIQGMKYDAEWEKTLPPGVSEEQKKKFYE